MIPDKFSLALGGGAARGFAHIGVIKYLEEKNIYPEEVSGTSMGAIIAACIAIKLHSMEIEKVISNINFFNLIDLKLKSGLIGGDKIKAKLKEIFGNKKIENLDISLRIVATNIETGEKIIFKTGYIYEALRASVSIPGIIAPYKYKGSLFVDGGISNNLPIEALEGKNIIAISVLRDLGRKINYKHKFLSIEFKKGIIGLNYQILQKTIDIMMKQNEDRSLNAKGKSIKYIHPSFPNIDYYEFHKYKEIIQIGYNNTKKHLQ